MKKNKKTILLVEDDAVTTAREIHFLKKEGYEIFHSATAEKAIEIVKNNPPMVNLILMDIDLGEGMDGTMAAEIILKDHDIPILFLSSHTEKEIVEKTEKISSYGYVVKEAGNTVLSASIKMAFKLYQAHIDLKDKEKALEESENIFNLFLENSPIYVFFKDKEIRSLKLSSNYEKMLNKPLNELLGKNMFDLFPSELAQNMVEDDKKILEQGIPIKVVEELNGRTYETLKFPIHKKDRESFLAGFTIDITDRIETEKNS